MEKRVGDILESTSAPDILSSTPPAQINEPQTSFAERKGEKVNESLYRDQVNNLQNSIKMNDDAKANRLIELMGDCKNPLALEPLIRLLGHCDETIRGNCALALGKIGDRKATEPLIKALNDPSIEVKKKVIAALGDLGDDKALLPLENMYIPAESPALLNTVRNAIYHINSKGHNSSNAEPTTRNDKYSDNKTDGKNGGIKKKRATPRKLKGAIPTAIFAIIFLILIVLMGTFVYGVLFPPVWTEQLGYKNSTGQYQIVTMYRNATDTSSANLTTFLAANDIESLVYADAEYKPVEYAAMLHDIAEASGINCTILGSQVSGDTPLHAIDAFRTTDRGMVYVDVTAMNVTQSNYTVPFDEIQLLRKKWTVQLPTKDANGVYDSITEYRDVQPVSYQELTSFLNNDDTVDATYVMPTYTCEDFAAKLHDDAESKGIKCGLVTIGFSDLTNGHEIDAFPTTDNGLVYIDCTGLNQTQKDEGDCEIANNAYLQVGSELGELPINQTNGDTSYAFYADRAAKIKAYRAEIAQYDSDVDAYNSAEASYEADVNNYNAQMDRHNSAVATFNSENTNEYNSYLGGIITYDQYLNWYNTNSPNVPAAPSGGGSLDSRKANLDQQSTNLNNRKAELDNSEESKWITYNPMGTVNDIETYWA